MNTAKRNASYPWLLVCLGVWTALVSTKALNAQGAGRAAADSSAAAQAHECRRGDASDPASDAGIGRRVGGGRAVERIGRQGGEPVRWRRSSKSSPSSTSEQGTTRQVKIFQLRNIDAWAEPGEHVGDSE